MSGLSREETGRRGERAVLEYLRREGFTILELNWRWGRYELDIIARKWDELHFVEVKTRRAASSYMAAHRIRLEPQFDLAAVDVFPDGSMQVRFMERAMECNW